MNKVAIKKGQIWAHKVSGKQVQIYRKHQGKWHVISVNGEKFNGSASHSCAPQTLWTKFVLLP